MHQRAAGSGVTRTPVQDLALPPRRIGSTGRSLRPVERATRHNEGCFRANTMCSRNKVTLKGLSDADESSNHDRHFAICSADVTKAELDPDEGLYDPVTVCYWRAHTDSDGRVTDSRTIRKVKNLIPPLRRQCSL